MRRRNQEQLHTFTTRSGSPAGLQRPVVAPSSRVAATIEGPSGDACQDVRAAIERLAACGARLTDPTRVLDWDGEPRQGMFVQLDERTCALHLGRGMYVRLDIQRDLNGVVPPEGMNSMLKRTGEVRPASRGGALEFRH